MAISRENLSGSTNGRPILIAATATAGDTVHDAHATAQDELFVWAWNSSGATVRITFEIGGVSDPGDIFEIDIPPVGAPMTLCLPGVSLTGSVNVDVFAGTTNVVSVFGHVNRVT